MVRPTSSVWTHFIEFRSGNKKTANCKYCAKKYLAPNATKMAKHLEVCKRKPVILSVPIFSREDDGDDPSAILDSQEIIIDPESASQIIHVSDAAPTASSSQLQKLNQPIISSFFDSMSVTESEKLDSAFAKAVYSSNSPLSLTDNPFWQQFFKQLRPSYKLPSRHELSTTLLDKEYEEVSQFVNEEIRKADFVTVITDGWSNVRNEGIVSYIVTTPTPIFYKSIETMENRHTALYISEELVKVINEIGAEKVTALVTDNANNMKAAWQIIQTQYAHIFTVGCAAHGLNLLLGDICKIKTFKMIVSNAKEVVKYVRNKQALLSVFTSKQKMKRGSASACTLKLPAETRWCSTLIMFESLLNGKESLQEAVLIEELNIDREIRKIVLDNDIFWKSIHSLVNVLSPICNGIKKIESDSATLSDVPHVFMTVKESLDSLILTPLQTEEEEAVKTVVETRRIMYCQPIHYAAYLLDPRYFETDLDDKDFRSGVDFISSFPMNEPTTNILANFAQYKSRDSVYSNQSVWESAQFVTPLVWWRGFFKSQCLSSVALCLFTIPPSSAACERIFSAFSLTHTRTRNRLSNERVSKLVSIRSNLILQSKTLPVDSYEAEND